MYQLGTTKLDILVNSNAKTSPKSMKMFVKARLKSEPPSPPMDSGQRLNPKFNYLKTEIIYAGEVFSQFFPYGIYFFIHNNNL